jgi:hypothetical protein
VRSRTTPGRRCAPAVATLRVPASPHKGHAASRAAARAR